MIRLSADSGSTLRNLFADMDDKLVSSYLDGCMGDGWTDDALSPTWGKIVVGDFGFLAGKPCREAVDELPPLVCCNAEWRNFLSQCRPVKITDRYAFEKHTHFDRAALERYAKRWDVVPIDHALYTRILAEDWCRDFVSVFRDWEHFVQCGAGFVVVENGMILGGASSYAAFRNGIEIEVDTHKEYRRRGIATACAARLILHCLDNGLYPDWDAANLASVGLAQKLGYTLLRKYPTVCIT